MICNLTQKDVSDIVRIHKNNLPSLINFYSDAFVYRFYTHHLEKAEETILVGYRQDSDLCGFVFGTLNIEDMFGSFIAKNKIYFIKQTILAVLKHPKYLMYIFQSFFSKGFQQEDSTCQLVYIAVDKRFKGSGFGKKLLLGFEKELKKRRDYYELEVEQNNPALDFYKSQGFTIVREINNILEKKFLMGKTLP